ncbi:MAG: putative 2OG-Fe(II) oxygenase [Aliidongia sp.]
MALDPVDILKTAVAAHRAGQPEQAAVLYRQALPGLDDIEFRRHCLLWLATALSDSGEREAAVATCRASIDLDPAQPAGFVTLAGMLLDLGRLDEAAAATRAALDLQPDDTATLNMAAHIALAQRAAAEAARHAEATLARNPADQRALSLLALALIQLGRDDAVARLLDFERLLQIGELAPPPGAGSPQSFGAALAEAVATRAELDRRHLGKTMVGGARLHDAFVIDPPLAEAMHQAFFAAASGYAERLAVDPDHPVARARPSELRLISWANIVEAKDFELPHIHDGSWISGVYYPEMPPETGDPDAGAIEFGGHDFGDALALAGPTRRLRPRPGTLVMFPAYFYHRTIPFAGAGRRISIAFDVRLAP